MNSVGSRVKKMLFAVFLGRGIMAIRQIVMVPLLIRLWGADCYGEWLTLSAIPSFLAMSNLGLGTAASIQIGIETASGEKQQAWSLFVSTSVLMLTVFSLLFVGFVSTLLLFPGIVGNFENLEFPTATVFCLAATTLLKSLAPTWGGWWVGVGKPSIANHWGNFNSFVELLICVLVVLIGGHAHQLAVALLAWNFVWLTAYSVSCLKMIHEKNGKLLRFEPQWLRTVGLLRTGLGHQLSPLWQAILFQGSILLAAGMLGPAGAALWGAIRIMVRSGCQVLELVSQSLGPEFQIASGNGDSKRLRKLHSVGLTTSVTISLIGFVLLMTAGPYIFALWTDNQFQVGILAWFTMTLSLVPFSMWWISGELHRSTNSPWFVNVCGVSISLIALGIMYCCSEAGIIGFCLGALLFDVLMAAFILKRTLKLLRTNLRQSILEGIYSLQIS